MRTSTKLFSTMGVAAVAAVALAFVPADAIDSAGQGASATPADADRTRAAVSPDGTWHIKASSPRIIGGYGDNFAYDGENVRPLEGSAVARVNPETGMGEVTIEVRTTKASGPIHFAKDMKWEGTLRVVQKLDTGQMDAARIAEDVFLHGDTGNEAPVMPKIYNYFATWGPSKIMVNGEEAVPMIGSHTMFTEQARGEDGRIDRGNTIYHPMKVKDKTGFTDADDLEFHYVAHTTEPDKQNFPPHTAWIHLHFSDVEVVSKPSDVSVPYTEADDGEEY